MDETPLIQVAFERFLDRIAKANGQTAKEALELIRPVVETHAGDSGCQKVARDLTWLLFPELRPYIRDTRE